MTSDTAAAHAATHGAPAPTPEAQVAWERRVGRWAALAAFASVAFSVASLLYYKNAHIPTGSDRTDEALHQVDLHSGVVIGTGVLQGLAILVVAPALWFLYRATRYRRPAIPRAALALAVAAPLAVAGFTIASQTIFTHVAHDYVSRPAPDASALHRITDPKAYADAAAALDPNERAKDALKDSSLTTISAFALAANLALGFAFVIVALNAMRAGLLSRFMGIIGIIIGVLYVLPVGGPFLQFFWFGALGFLFLDRWPRGRGPAWETGEAIPWPTAGDLHGDGGDRPTLLGGRPRPDSGEAERSEAPEPPERAEAQKSAAVGAAAARRKKRKRKRS